MKALDAAQAAEVVKGIAPAARHAVVRKLADAERIAKEYGFPVVLKALSPKIIHKTEAGAVRIVHSAGQLEKDFASLQKLAPSILAQEFVKGNEFIIGLKKDPTFGHVIIAGVGGIYVELYRDVSFRVCPVAENDAEAMLDELKGRGVFTARGKNLNRRALVDAIVKLSRLPERQKNIAELDINPFILNEKQGVIVDARVVLE